MPDYVYLFETTNTQGLLKRLNLPICKKINSLSLKTLEQCVPLRDATESTALHQRLLKAKQVRTIHDLIRLYRG